MCAAIKSAQDKENKVTLIEKMNSLRKKIAYYRERKMQHYIVTSN